MTRLTKRIVEGATPKVKEYYLWDEDIPGLGLRVMPSGRKQYIVQYRAGRRSRRISLGPHTVLTAEQARTNALSILSDARSGKDPAAERARADLPEVRIHDLRHTFASTAIAAGHSLPIIGKLLGHTQVQTTARYAHLAAQPAVLAADSISDVLDQAMIA